MMPKKKLNTKVEVFSKDDIPLFRELVITKREELMKELGYIRETTMEKSYQEYTGEHSTYSYHMADQGSDAQEREKAFLFASREGKFLVYLDRALKKMDEGTYGYCEDCGEPIAKARLEAVPTAKLCMTCKSKQEEAAQP
jgi:DnaK suppressor protein